MDLAVSVGNGFSRWGLFGHRQAWHWTEEVTVRLGVCATGPGQMLRRLSGSNQQRVAISEWLCNHVSVLILNKSAKGVDVKAKTDLFMPIDGLARRGEGIIYTSSKFAELVDLCDRICALWDGRIVAKIPDAKTREEMSLYYPAEGVTARARL